MDVSQEVGAFLQLLNLHSNSAKLLRQAAEELASTNLPQRLPAFIWQSVQTLAAAGLPLGCKGLHLTVSLSSKVALATNGKVATGLAGLNWHWASQLLQQLLICAVGAGVLRALPGGSVAAAAVAISQKSSSSSSSSSGGGNCGSSSVTGDEYLRRFAHDIADTASGLISVAEMRLRQKPSPAMQTSCGSC
ncbi:hypothetical protein OEZ85_009584 [Tetradesmus obliquus]|uniref:Uncharacterized protein n=1 Tax=Tetradesmus obliquus TaxID=3088 RepID=A0ABY8UDD0_TETOB|nr:hypothetical protein OEZ85_009584 [Tetradesmus obliquus]